MTDSGERPEALDAGWAALRAGRWAEARQIFQRASEGASPEALEGLSWAAWWLDDATTVFAARERAFRGYQDAGDAASAARLALWLASDQLDFHGALATASGWLGRAQRLLEQVEAGAEHGWLAFHQGYIAVIRGQLREAERYGVMAAQLGRESRVADLEMLGLALQGMSLVSRAEVARGMRCLDEASAIALAGEATIPISAAWTCCFMVTACTRVFDFERAFEWCDRIAEFAEQYGSRYMLGFCRAEYATIYLWRGDWRAAEQALEESLSSFAASRPAMSGGPLVGLAELRRRQGKSSECQKLLEQAGTSSRGQLCRARLALDEGDSLLALDLSQRVLRGISDDRPLERIAALELLVRAQLARGAIDEAAGTSEVLASIARVVSSPGLTAQVRLAEGLIAAARSQHERARLLLEDAVDGFERCGARFDSACARIELGSALRALGRPTDARREAALAHAALRDLGATVAAARAKQLLDPSECGGAAARTSISRREMDVLGLLSRGMTNREIAERLCISEHTVHRHVTSILRKLDAPSRTAAAALALRKGIVSPE